MGVQHKNDRSIFAAALKLEDLAERAAYLKKACGADADLLARIEALLAAHDEAGDFLESPPFGADVTLDTSPLAEQPGTTIGNYKLLEQIGEGGMAVVYMAEQEKPLRRRVALKIIKLGMDTKQVIARFEAERQALAVMDHPNIAHVFDAGTTDSGRPYFVMEYVRGLLITEHCDNQKLTIEERLQLFTQICDAIQYAHEQGIIHRDIKPSNVLVSIYGKTAIPKVIDFGIAKAMNQPLTGLTMLTEQGQLLGTPEYMSPEQVEMTHQKVDARSDIYSLGIMLYELLTGALPFDAKTLREGGVTRIRHIIREEEPKTPSMRLSGLGEQAEKIAESRRTDIRTLARCLHRELEWIPLKAMRKEQTRRYRSVLEFAQDVNNYLSGNPLIAGPESLAYRIGKSLRKHKAQTLGVFFVALALTAGVFIGSMILGRTFLLKSVAFTSGGGIRQAIISDNKIKVWDSSTHAEIMAVPILGSGATRFALSPQGVYLAASGSDGELTVWNVDSATELGGFEGHQRPIVALAFSWDEGYLCSYSEDGTIKIWSVADGAEVSTLQTESRGITALALGRNARYVALGSKNGRLIVRETNSGSKVTAFTAHRSRITTLAYSPSGTQIVSGSKRGEIKIWAWELANVREVFPVPIKHNRGITAVAFNQDGKQIVWASFESTLRVLDSATGVELMSLSPQVFVTVVNHPPVLNVIGDRSVDENSSLTFQVEARDVDSDTIAYLAENLPTGTTFENRLFKWTPTYDQAGTYQVKFIASDGQHRDSETVTIEVRNVNRPPKIADVVGKTVEEGISVTFTISATDPDNDIIKYSASGLPRGAVFLNQRFTWMPDYGQAGTHLIGFVADDSQSQTSASVEIVVKERAGVGLATVGKQDADRASPGKTDVDRSIAEDGPEKTIDAPATVRGGTFYMDAVNGNDVGSGASMSPWMTLAWCQRTVPDGSTVFLRDGNYRMFEDEMIGRNNWVVYKAAKGHSPIFDGIDLSGQDATRNLYLIFEGITIEPREKSEEHEDKAIKCSGVQHVKFIDMRIRSHYAYGEETDSVGISLEDINDIETRACDISGFAAGIQVSGQRSKSVSIEGCRIYNCRKAIEITGETGSHIDGITLESNATWGCTDTLVEIARCAGLILRGNTFVRGNTSHGQGLLHIGENCAVTACSGNFFYNVKISDAVQFDYEDYNVYCNALSGRDLQGSHTVMYGSEGESEFKAIFADYDSNDFHLLFPSEWIDYCPLDAVPTQDLTGQIRVDIPEFGKDGSDYGDVGCYEKGSRNSAPVLNEVGSKSVNENRVLTFTVSAIDADDGMITYLAQNLPTGATFSSQTFSWTPSYSQAGSYQVTFIARDGSAQDSETITITVNNVNRAPVLAAIGNKSVNEGSLLSFSVSATDPDSDTITYSAQNLPSGATFSNRTFSWTPGYDQEGSFAVTFIASDGTEQDSETITITVGNTNRAPVLAAIGNKTVNENTTLNFSVSATDADGNPITYSVEDLPSGAAFASQNFIWTPGYDQAGTFEVTFNASDGQDQDSETITITVNNVNRAPVLDAIVPDTGSYPDFRPFGCPPEKPRPRCHYRTYVNLPHATKRVVR